MLSLPPEVISLVLLRQMRTGDLSALACTCRAASELVAPESESRSERTRSALQQHGFALLDVDPSAEMIVAAQRGEWCQIGEHFEPIFNAVTADGETVDEGDSHRQVSKLSPNHACRTQRAISDALDRVRLREPHAGDERKQRKRARSRRSWKNVSDTRALLSLPGCARQPAHVDVADKSKVGPFETSLSDLSIDNMPMSVLAALQDGTRLLLRPRGSDAFISMPIPVGKMLVWRADVVHAGPSYKDSNVRIHAYLDSASCHRPPNETFPVVLSEAGLASLEEADASA